MLIDSFNRVIDYLRISVTDRCNLRCKYCFDGTFNFIPHGEVLTYEEIVRFAKICAGLGITKIRLTGGEPLARKGLCYLLGELNKIHGINDVSMTTNGVFLRREIKKLKESGLKRINISLDTLKREKFAFITGVDALNDVLAGIELAAGAGLNPIKINTVVIKGFNDDEITDFLKIANEFGAQVRFIEYMTFGDSNMWNSVNTITSAEIEGKIKNYCDLKPAAGGRGPAKMFSINAGRGKVGFISPVSSNICEGCNRIRLTSAGTVRPCLFSSTQCDIKKLLRGGNTDDDIAGAVNGIVKIKPESKPDLANMRKCRESLRFIGG